MINIKLDKTGGLTGGAGAGNGVKWEQVIRPDAGLYALVYIKSDSAALPLMPQVSFADLMRPNMAGG